MAPEMGPFLYKYMSGDILMKLVPFTAYFQIEEIAGKRSERTYNLHYIAEEIYEALSAIAGINIAKPGGGQSKVYFSEHGALSNMVYGCGVKPAFGDTPAQAMITGFYTVENDNDPAYSETQIFSAGAVYTASRSTSYNASPVTQHAEEVKALKLELDNAVSDLGFDCELYKLEYNGVKYGARGLHFPR